MSMFRLDDPRLFGLGLLVLVGGMATRAAESMVPLALSREESYEPVQPGPARNR